MLRNLAGMLASRIFLVAALGSSVACSDHHSCSKDRVPTHRTSVALTDSSITWGVVNEVDRSGPLTELDEVGTGRGTPSSYCGLYPVEGSLYEGAPNGQYSSQWIWITCESSASTLR